MTPPQLEGHYNCSYHSTEPDGDLNYSPYKRQGLEFHAPLVYADVVMHKSEMTYIIIDVIFRNITPC